MNPWLMILIVVLAVVAFIILLSTLSSVLINGLAHGFADKTRKKYTQLLENELPGKNCGDCGCENCRMYAAAI